MIMDTIAEDAEKEDQMRPSVVQTKENEVSNRTQDESVIVDNETKTVVRCTALLLPSIHVLIDQGLTNINRISLA